jgi:hypothetical protein
MNYLLRILQMVKYSAIEIQEGLWIKSFQISDTLKSQF